jgi:hypothetical protein
VEKRHDIFGGEIFDKEPEIGKIRTVIEKDDKVALVDFVVTKKTKAL